MTYDGAADTFRHERSLLEPGYRWDGRNPIVKTLATLTLLMAAVLVSGGTSAFGQEKAAADESSYAGMPWHLVDIWWDIGEDRPFQSYSIDVTIGEDIPSSSNLYIAPIGLGHLGKTQFYGGIQTHVDGHTRKSPQIRELGPGFLFSMWGERSLDAIRPSLGGFCQSSGHEGDFVSARRPYEWHKGAYTFKIVRMDEEEVDGQPCTWVGVFVESKEKDEHVFVGALRFPGKDLVLSRNLASFVEVYGRRIPVGEIPRVTVTLGNLVVNGKPVKIESAQAVYPKRVPDYADTMVRDGRLVITVGKPVEARTLRTVRLIPGDGEKP
jgi:hypothetical protein